MNKILLVFSVAAGTLLISGCGQNSIQDISSSNSIEHRVAALYTYQAESALLESGAKVTTNHTGYSGTGFVDGYYNSSTAKTTFTFNAPSAGSYTITLRYSAGNAQSTNTGLYINNVYKKNITCPKTVNWDTWANQVETVTLNAGSNKIAYKAMTSSTACINIDRINVDGPSCNISVSSQPANSTVLCGSSNSVSFSVQTTGATVSTYQWYYNIDNSSNGSICTGRYFAGGTTATLISTPDQTKFVWCVITSTCGATVTSNRAKLTVGPTRFSLQPVSVNVPCGNTDQVRFSVMASGSTSYTYQWYYSTDYSPTPVACMEGRYFAGVTTATLTTIPDQIKYLYCQVTGSCGQVITSNTAKLTVCQ